MGIFIVYLQSLFDLLAKFALNFEKLKVTWEKTNFTVKKQKLKLKKPNER
jgi:hypothetical protein